MNKRYLFIANSDLSMEDSNGRTLRDVFGYVNWEYIFSFCIKRKNPYLSSQQTFCINESQLFKKKLIHRDACSNIEKNVKNVIQKNPLTCLIRNCLWNLSFLFWKGKLKKWIKKVNPDIIVFNPGDFLFMHKIALFVSKICNKKLVIYNTEDYYFKTWNYLHDERGFKRLYPIFRKKLIHAYQKSFNCAKIIIHNTYGLFDDYSKAFKSIKQTVILHPSFLKANYNENQIKPFKKIFYFCGNLDKGRDKTLFMFAKCLNQIIPEAMIFINGYASSEIIAEMDKYKNIKYKGVVSYQDVVKHFYQRCVLLSINSLDEYQVKDKKHAFSTKIGDYIASFNLIFHISLPNDEFNTLKDNNLAFVSSNENEIISNLIKVSKCIEEGNNVFLYNMIKFYDKFLKPDIVCKKVREEVE